MTLRSFFRWELFAQAGYFDIQVQTEPDKGWIYVIGRKL